MRNKKGITLVALVITIIVLLILAGVSLRFIAGEDGILQKAEQATEKTNYAIAYEIVNLKISEAYAEKERVCTLEELEEFLGREEEVEVVIKAYNKTAKKAEGIGEYEVGKLENFVVSVVEYPQFHFLINKKCVIEKISKDYGNTFVAINKTEEPGNQDENDWKKVLTVAGIDASQFETFEDALADENVAEKITNLEEIENLELVAEENPYYTFVAKAGEKYFIQCFGAQGGSYSEVNHGGYGGYSYGIFTPAKDTTLYIYKGGAGKNAMACDVISGGYNGGGAVIDTWSDGNEKRASGGGATHIALSTRIIIKFGR